MNFAQFLKVEVHFRLGYKLNKRIKSSLLLFLLICKSAVYGQTVFSEVSEEAGIDHVMNSINLFGGGAAFFDYNNDGNLDLYLTGGNTRNDVLYKGDGAGNFIDVTESVGLGFTSLLVTYGVTSGDIDNDGDRDILLCTGYGTPTTLLLNNGDGTFTDISIDAGFADTDRHKHGAVFGDFNLDGYLDIYITSWVETFKLIKNAANETIGYAHKCFENLLYVNNGDLTFTEVAQQYGVNDEGCGLVPAFTDYDNDGDMDAMIVNDFGEWVLPNGLFRNEFPLDSFKDVSSVSNMNQAMYGMGVAIGDYDRDQDLDYYFTSIGHNFLMNNQGDGTFVDVATELNVEDDTIPGTEILKTSWGTAFLDVDNDGFLDLFVADGKVGVFLQNANNDPNKLYWNNGNGGFEDISAAAGIDDGTASRAMVYGDYDNDGDLDIFVSVSRRDTTFPGHGLLFRNELSNGYSYLKVTAQGVKCNRDAFGAHITVYVDGQGLLHEIDGGSSYRSQHQTAAHFGLGEASEVDSLVIVWPGGRVQKLYDIAVNQHITIVEDTNIYPNGMSRPAIVRPAVNVYPNPTGNHIQVVVESKLTSAAFAAIFDIQGRELAQKSMEFKEGKSSVQFNLSDLSAGVYWLRISDNNFNFSEKVILKK